MACCSDRVDMASWMQRIQLIDVPYEIKQNIAEYVDGDDHPTINPVNFGEQLGLSSLTAEHVAKHWEGPCPTMRILAVLQKKNVTLWHVYCVLKEMNSPAVKVLKGYWLHEACQGIPGGNQGHRSMDLQIEPSNCACGGCQNNLSHAPSLQPPYVSQTSNFPPLFNDMDDSTRTKTIATDSEENLPDDQEFFPPEEPESDSDSVSELMNALEKIGIRNSPSIVEVSDGSPVAQRFPARPVNQGCSCQDHPMPADSALSSHTPPISTPGPRNSQRPGGLQPEQVQYSFSSSQCSQPASPPQPPSKGCSCGSPLCGPPPHNEHNHPWPGNVPGDGNNFHLGSQQQHWNNPAPEVRAQSPPSGSPQSSSPQPVHHQLQVSRHRPVSLENPWTAAPVPEANLVRAAQQHALETAQQAWNPPSAPTSQQAWNPSPAPTSQQAWNPSPAPTSQQAWNPSPAPPQRQRQRSLTYPYVLVVFGEKDWMDDMEAEITTAVLDLLYNNEIPCVICSPNRHWHAQPEDLVDQEDVRRDNDAFRERVFRKASAIIVVITPKVRRYAKPSLNTRDGVRQDVSNIVRSMRSEVSRPAGNKRFFPVIMTQLGANKKHNFDCLMSTITYSFPSNIQQRDFICHLQRKLPQR